MIGVVYVPEVPLILVSYNLKISKECSTQTTYTIMSKRIHLNNFEILPPLFSSILYILKFGKIGSAILFWTL